MKNSNDSYEDIRHLTRPQYADYPPMPVSDRAAQFSPFAALTGYGDAVLETERLTEARFDERGEIIEIENQDWERGY